MEVPHHPHTSDPDKHRERKKWRHYFWEFLMLFLAVFCGFLAELQFEHYIEHQREKKYARLLLSDLKKDTAVLARFIWRMEKDLANYDSSRLLFNQNPGMGDDDFVRLARRLPEAYTLATVPTTFTQMKYSGSLRYIRSDSLSVHLNTYYELLVPRLSTFFDFINDKLHTQIEPFFAQHFDLNVSRSSFEKELPPGLKYYNRTVHSDLLIRNYFQMYFNGVEFIYNVPLRRAHAHAVNLIHEIETEYSLK